ncbi:protein kinase [Aureococcus anophagefferens]|nr:protein kinase [Aureococcus anophagefferens]
MGLQAWVFHAVVSAGAQGRQLDGQSVGQLSLDAVDLAGEDSDGCGDPGPSAGDAGLIVVSGTETGAGCLEDAKTWFGVFRDGEEVSVAARDDVTPALVAANGAAGAAALLDSDGALTVVGEAGGSLVTLEGGALGDAPVDHLAPLDVDGRVVAFEEYGDSAASEVLLVSKYFYARVDAADGVLLHADDTDGRWLPEDSAAQAAYDPARDCLWSVDGTTLRMSATDTGAAVYDWDYYADSADLVALSPEDGGDPEVVALVVVRRRRDAEKQEAFEDEATALEILKTEETKDIESYGAGLRAPSCTIAEFEVELRHVEDEPFARGGQGTVHLAEYQGEAVCLKKMSQLGMSAADRQRMFSQFSRELAIMSRIEHRDLKSLNCLLTHDGRGKVCDFGLSKCDDLAATRATAGLCGTPAFMAPEYLDGAMFHQKCDVYSYAMVLYEIWTRGFPWEGLSPPQIIAKVVVQRLRPEVPPSIPRDMRARMTACWAHDASVRPSFKDIVTSLDASTPRPRTKGPWDHVPLLEGDAHVRPMRTYERSTVLKRVLESAELLHGDSSRSTLSRCSSGGSENLGVERRRLRDRLRDFGLREHAVAGDGNCQFRAIAHQLCGNDERHDAVRKRVVGQLALEPERYAEFCMVEDAEDADFESFVRRMADDGEWGDAVTLQAAADVYGVVVCLVTSYAERGIFRVEPRARLEAPRPDAPPIPNAPPPRSLGSREFDEEVAHVVSAGIDAAAAAAGGDAAPDAADRAAHHLARLLGRVPLPIVPRRTAGAAPL